MSIPEIHKHPVTEVSLESYIRLTLIDPDLSNDRTSMRGVNNSLFDGEIVVGKVYKMGNNDNRTVVFASSYEIIFYRDDEKKLFGQDVVGFSLDVQFSAFAIAGQKSIGTVYFASIVMGLISAGFAVTSFPAFILVAATDLAQGVNEVKNDPTSMAIIKFVISYVGIQKVLRRVAPELSSLLFYSLVKEIKSNIIKEIDPEAVMKIFVTLIANVLMKKLKLSNKIRRSQNKITRKALVFQISMALAKLNWEVLKVLPASVYKTGTTFEKHGRELAIKIGQSLNHAGVLVQQKEYSDLIEEFKNIIVLDQLIELREASLELRHALKQVK